jgi:hypothetical protein
MRFTELQTRENDLKSRQERRDQEEAFLTQSLNDIKEEHSKIE